MQKFQPSFPPKRKTLAAIHDVEERYKVNNTIMTPTSRQSNIAFSNDSSSVRHDSRLDSYGKSIVEKYYAVLDAPKTVEMPVEGERIIKQPSPKQKQQKAKGLKQIRIPTVAMQSRDTKTAYTPDTGLDKVPLDHEYLRRFGGPANSNGQSPVNRIDPLSPSERAQTAMSFVFGLPKNYH